jgi:hypothetical protein
VNSNTHFNFVLSLNFELFWGVWDVTSIKKYGTSIPGVQKAFSEIPEVFIKYDIVTTVAKVGSIFAKDKIELLASLHHITPTIIKITTMYVKTN